MDFPRHVGGFSRYNFPWNIDGRRTIIREGRTRMKRNENSGLTLVEVSIATVIISIVFFAVVAGLIVFSKTNVSSLQIIRMHALMNAVKNRLYNDSKGPAWYTMQSIPFPTTDSNFPGLVYGATIGSIQAGARACNITVVRPASGGSSYRVISSSFTLIQRRGRQNGGQVKVVVTDADTPSGIAGVEVRALSFEGTSDVVQVTGTDGTTILSGVKLSPPDVTVRCDLDQNQTPYYFPADGLSPAGLVKSSDVPVALGVEALVQMTAKAKRTLNMNVYERNNGINTSVPVTSAVLYLESTATIIPGLEVAQTVETTSGLNIFRLVPGSYRVTVISAMSGTQARVGLDRPNSFLDSLDFFTLGINDPPLTKNRYVVAKGDLQGEVRKVNWRSSPNYDYDFTNNTIQNVDLWLKVDDYYALYDDNTPPTTKAEMTNTVGKNIWYTALPVVNAQSNASGIYLGAGMAPLLIYRHDDLGNFGAYTPEDARGTVFPRPNYSVPNQATPVAVVTTASPPPPITPATRDNTYFIIVDTGGAIVGYPQDPIDNELDSLAKVKDKFKFRTLAKLNPPANPAYNQGKHVYLLANSNLNLVRLEGNIWADTVPVADRDNTNRLQRAGAVVSIRGQESFKNVPAFKVESSGGQVTVLRNPRDASTQVGLVGRYNVDDLIPMLGSNQMLAAYKQWTAEVVLKNFKVTPKIYYIWYDIPNDRYLYESRTGDSADDFTASLQVQALEQDDSWSTMFTRSVTVNNGADIILNSENARQHDRWEGTSTAALIDPSPSAQTQNIIASLMPDVMATHRVEIMSLSPSYRPRPRQGRYFPLPTFVDPLYSGEMELELVAPIGCYGRVYRKATGEIITARVTFHVFTEDDTILTSVPNAGTPPAALAACPPGLPCPSVPQYNTVIKVPHTAGAWNLWVHCESAGADEGQYEPLDSPAVQVYLGLLVYQFDCAMVGKPGSGL